MIELPDDELDRLFRKSAEEFDPTFDPQDWNKLKKRLDEEDGQRPGYLWLKKGWPLLLAGLLFLGGAGLYLLLKESGKTAVNREMVQGVDRALERKAANGEAIKAEPDVNTKPAEEKAKHPLAANTGNDIKAMKIKPRSESKASGVFLESDYSKTKSGTGAILLPKSRNDVVRRGRKNGNGPEARATLKNENVPELSEVSQGNQGTNSRKSDGSSLGSSEKNLENGSHVAEMRPSMKIDLLESRSYIYDNKLSIGGPSIPRVEPRADMPEKGIAAKPDSPKFAVRFGVSPDFSSVQFMKGTRVGSAVSLLGEYAIIPRLYLQAGMVRSVKKYVASQGYYKWPGSWTQPVMPQSVDAICKIVELPFNLRYDIYSGERSRWFASAGTSSYQMKDEKYEYNYQKHVPGIKWYGWQGATGWYWFSHLNASLGYEYRLSHSVSLMAEPYITVPIKKVGFGEVNLFTTGIWISVRYTPFHK